MNKRIVAIGVAGLLIGALIGPPVVMAATRLVTIKGAGTDNKAKVSGKGRLSTDTEAGVTQGFLNTLALTSPGGVATITQGTTSTSVPADFGVLTNVVVDLPTGQSAVTVELADAFGEIWQGTVDGTGRHINDTFDSGLVWVDNLTVPVTGTGAEYSLSGLVLGGARDRDSSTRADALDALLRARRGR